MPARDKASALTGPDGLLKALTKTVIEAALDEEMTEHLGYDKHAPAGRNRGNSRNGKRSKTVLTDSCGEVEIEVPRDRDGSFEPQMVKKRQRRLSDVDEVVLSLYAKGLTTGEISAHFAEVYGASVSKDTVSRITDRVIEEMQAWWARPLEKVTRRCSSTRSWSRSATARSATGRSTPRSGSTWTATRTSSACGPATATGSRRSSGWRCSPSCRNRGVKDMFFVVCDGLKGLPDSVNAVFPPATVQTCIIHLIRNTFRYASTQVLGPDRPRPASRSTPPRPPPSARAAFEEFEREVGQPLPGDQASCGDNAWEEFIPFLDYDVEIRKVLCSHERDRVA